MEARGLRLRGWLPSSADATMVAGRSGGPAMEMHQVRYFVALCETLNFTRAAERCHVAQPSLTRAIKLLEEELGGPLFHRERNNTHLTELGRLMEPHLKEVLDQAHNARRRASAFFELKTARLKLGVSRGVPLGPLDAVLGRYAADYPETEIHLIDDRAPALREALLRGDLEVILLPLRATDLDELHYHPISEERVEVLLAATHPLAARDGIELAALAGETVVTCETCPFWPTIEDRLGQAGLTVRRRIVAGEVDWLRPFVRAGLGVGLRSTGHGLAEGLLARPLVDLDLIVQSQLATRRGRLYSPPVKAFIDLALRPRGRQPDSRARTGASAAG